MPDDGLPKPTEALKMRTEDLGIEKNLNKTMIVQTSTTGAGPRGAGFYVCILKSPASSQTTRCLDSKLTESV